MWDVSFLGPTGVRAKWEKPFGSRDDDAPWTWATCSACGGCDNDVLEPEIANTHLKYEISRATIQLNTFSAGCDSSLNIPPAIYPM